MDFLSRYNLTAGKVAKMAGVAVAFVMVLVLLGSLVGSLLPGAGYPGRLKLGLSESATYGNVAAPAPSMAYPGGGADYDGISLSARNVMPVDPGVPGDDAEEFEVLEYSATIESRDVARDCAVIADLKKDQDIVFLQSSEAETRCNYSFKVKKTRVADVLATLEKLDPRDLDEHTRTIKRQVADYTSELEILQKKEASIDATLESAIASYDGISQLATRTQDVESLTRIIESKLQIIERLTQEHLRVSEQQGRLARAKAEELDKLDYATFSVHVYESAFVNVDQLKDSWKERVQALVRAFNEALQNATVNLLAFIVTVLPLALYAVLAIVSAKYAWRLAKYLWRK